MKQTEVQRIGRELEQGNVSGEALRRKYQTAARGDVKLACALRGYFSEGNDFYFPYIKTRIRPAASELILAGRVSDLARLEEQLTPALTEEFLELAISARAPGPMIWLLQMKERRFGFKSQELTL